MATTWNPSDGAADLDLSGDELTVTGSGVSSGKDFNSIRSTKGHSGFGKFYFEITLTGDPNNSNFGLCNGTQGLAVNAGSQAPGLNGNSIAVYDGGIFSANTELEGASWGGLIAGHTYGIAVDLSSSKFWAKDITAGGDWNGHSGASPSPQSSGISFSITGGTLFPFFCVNNTSDITQGGTANFDGVSAAFAGTAPSGYVPWDQYQVNAAEAMTLAIAVAGNVSMDGSIDEGMSLSDPSPASENADLGVVVTLFPVPDPGFVILREQVTPEGNTYAVSVSESLDLRDDVSIFTPPPHVPLGGGSFGPPYRRHEPPSLVPVSVEITGAVFSLSIGFIPGSVSISVERAGAALVAKIGIAQAGKMSASTRPRGATIPLPIQHIVSKDIVRTENTVLRHNAFILLA